jgi:Mg2+ and Co2+ transporter CorA
MRRMKVYGKNGYAEYIRDTQEKLASMDAHLAQIETLLRRIADRDHPS